MRKPINVLSLFDGMSCGRLALADANIPVAQYQASEVDKFAIQVTTANWPDTVQLGSVTDVAVAQHYDLLIGGSPCQSFSFAGKRKGMSTKDEQEILTLDHYKQLKADGYEFEGQSYLFWEYVRILAECRAINPNIKFMLENVVMAEKWERVITQTLGVKPIKINSALVSAQNRERLYWTNIGLQPAGLFGFEESIIQQPKDCGILLKDILQTNVPEKYYLGEQRLGTILNSDRSISHLTNASPKSHTLTTQYAKNQTDAQYIDEGFVNGTILNGEFKERTGGKSLNIDANYHKGHDNHGARTVIQVNPSAEFGDQPRRHNWVYSTEGIAPALLAGMSCGTHAILEDTAQCVAMRGRMAESGNNEQQIEPRNDGKTNTLTSVQKDNLVMLNERQQANYKTGEEKANKFLSTAYKGSQANGMTLVGTTRIRRLTPTECERLQTVPDGYTAHVSDTQRYKMLGNGWNIKVIAHIFTYL